MSKIKTLAVLIPVEGCEAGSVSDPLFASGGLGHSLAFRWHSPCVFTLSSFYMSVSVSNFPFYKDNNSIGLGPTLIIF